MYGSHMVLRAMDSKPSLPNTDQGIHIQWLCCRSEVPRLDEELGRWEHHKVQQRKKNSPAPGKE